MIQMRILKYLCGLALYAFFFHPANLLRLFV
jgi:hypothetical protein